MKKHKSEDYKISAVKYYLKHKATLKNTCKIFDCSSKSLYRWIERYKKNGNIKRKKTIKPRYKVTNEIEKFILSLVKKETTISLWELSKLVNKKYKIKLTDMTIYRILKRHKITRKRLRRKYYPEKKVGQEQDDLDTFYQTLHSHNYKKTISLDETSIYLNMTLSYGRSKSGRRVIKKTHKYPFKRYNLLVAIAYNKVVGWILYENLKGGVKKEELIDFYKLFIKNKYTNHLILMDNAAPHKSLVLKQLIHDTNNTLLHTVPYNPQTNPIEEFFSQLKHYIRKRSPQDYNEIKTVIREILQNNIKKKHLENYFKHSFKIYT
jgi:putative transposase